MDTMQEELRKITFKIDKEYRNKDRQKMLF